MSHWPSYWNSTTKSFNRRVGQQVFGNWALWSRQSPSHEAASAATTFTRLLRTKLQFCASPSSRTTGSRVARDRLIAGQVKELGDATKAPHDTERPRHNAALLVPYQVWLLQAQESTSRLQDATAVGDDVLDLVAS